MSEDAVGKAARQKKLELLVRWMRKAVKSFLDLFHPAGSMIVYRVLWNRARGIKDVTLRGILSDKPVNANLCDVKLIAYYVPQACSSTENDLAIGQWRDVAKAIPLFVGHYQPRLPSELGFYDLRVTDVIRRQVKLARLYGISAFCFEFYWFYGARPFETAIMSYLENQDLDLPFCLCWRNQNVTLKSQRGKNFTIEQRYSADDDIALIRYLKSSFDDPRYLKINDKPALAVYQSDLLPNAAGTVERWRNEAVGMGLKGLYLVAINTNKVSSPQTLGFDCVAEFPPHRVPRRSINDELKFVMSEHSAKVYSYAAVVETCSEDRSSAPKVWPGVMPSWDSCPSRPKNGDVFHGSSPRLFREWLDASILRARKNPVNERFVMLNAWNDWAHGAYLEPDDRFGYAYLSACGSAIGEKVRPDARVSGLFAAQREQFRATRPLAVILHLFYEDLADEFARRLREFGELDTYLTVSNDISPATARRITDLFPDAYVQEVANRGRDMLPFLTTFETVREGKHRFVCKLHTKRSPYLRDGNAWRNELLTNLLSQSAHEALCAAENMPKIGVLACKGSLATLANESERCPILAARIQSLAARKALTLTFNEPFVAGSMFWFRPEAMQLFSTLASPDEFEPELGQFEGTLPHALERLTIIAARAAGYDFVEIDGASVKPQGVPWVRRPERCGVGSELTER